MLLSLKYARIVQHCGAHSSVHTMRISHGGVSQESRVTGSHSLKDWKAVIQTTVGHIHFRITEHQGKQKWI